jgi:hypothetical protein
VDGTGCTATRQGSEESISERSCRGNYWTCPHCRGEKHTLHVIRHRAISGAVTLNCPKCADLSLVLKALGDWNERDLFPASTRERFARERQRSTHRADRRPSNVLVSSMGVDGTRVANQTEGAELTRRGRARPLSAYRLMGRSAASWLVTIMRRRCAGAGGSGSTTALVTRSVWRRFAPRSRTARSGTSVRRKLSGGVTGSTSRRGCSNP